VRLDDQTSSGYPSNRTWLCQASQPDADHGEHDEGGDWAYRSKWRAKRRLRLIQARVRSTIQRLGRTMNAAPAAIIA